MGLFGKKRIFLDHAAGVGNPTAIYKEGVEAKKKLEEARQKIARILGCQTRDVVFTSGGTESDNLAILGVEKGHIIISDKEHPAILESAKEAERRGSELDIVPAEQIISKIKENTVLISLSYAVSETGEIQNVPKIARAVRDWRKKHESRYPYIHTDATQAFESLPCDVSCLSVDLLTIDNVFVVRPNVSIRPLIFGGGHERGLRSGTPNVDKAVETAKEFEKVEKNREVWNEKLSKIKEVFLAELHKALPQAVVNTPQLSVPNVVSVSFSGKLHEFLAIQLDEEGVAVSTGSSCDSAKNEPDKEALRFSFGETTSEKEVRESVRILAKIML